MKQQPTLKRGQDSSLQENSNKKLKDSEIVTLDDSSNDEEEDNVPEKITINPPHLKLASIEGLVIQKVVEPLQNSGGVQKNSKSVDTSCVSQIEAFKQAESDDNNKRSEANISYSCDVIELDDEEPVNVNSLGNERTGLSIDFVSTVAKVEADVNTVISDDEDDDIMVLEQKLAAARQQLGGGRHYLETSKASSRAGNKVLGSSRYFLLKIAMTFFIKGDFYYH